MKYSKMVSALGRTKILFLFALVLILSNCTRKNNGFEEYYNKIPIIKLPLTITCGLCGNDSLVSDSLIGKYAFKGAKAIGRLEDDKNIYIIYNYPGDICYPYLYTYNQQGKILDSLYLHISTCAEDEYLGYSTWSVIHPDKSIDMTDTTKHFMTDEIKGERFLTSIVIKKRTYKMGSGGILKLSIHTKDSTICHKLIP
jgi:hypothetical protein